MVALERTVQKKASTRKVFESVLAEIQTTLEEPSFKEKNRSFLKRKKSNQKSEIHINPLSASLALI